ncbi:MAG: ATP-binding protein [Candidatus Magasanikbacteria bacterium]
MSKIIPRAKQEKIMDWMDRSEFIAIKGPRQAGKTTLLKDIIKDKLINERGIDEKAVDVINFENRNLVDNFEDEPLNFIKTRLSDQPGKNYILIDEYQYVDDGGQKLKLIYDELHEDVKIIITGSNSLELTDESARYMVGRMFSLYLSPLTFKEFLFSKNDNVVRNFDMKNEKIKNFFFEEDSVEIEQKQDTYPKIENFFEEYAVFGAYPAVVTAQKEETKQDILQQIVNTYIEKDIIRLLKQGEVKKFRKLLKLVSVQTGNLLNYEQITSNLDIHFKKVKKLLSLMEETFLIKRIKPLHENMTTELKKQPKVYFLDMGLRNFLTSNFNDLDLRTDKGEIVKSMILSDIYYNQKDKADIFYWRTKAGAEVDFIIRKGSDLYPIEVKYKKMKNLNITKSVLSFIKNYDPERFLILTRGSWGQREVEGTKVLFAPIWYFDANINL